MNSDTSQPEDLTDVNTDTEDGLPGDQILDDRAAREKELKELHSEIALRPTVQAARTIQQFSKGFGDLDITQLIFKLRDQTSAILDGDLGRAEAMLAAQAHTLDSIFNRLAQCAALNLGEYLGAAEKYMKLALRAQSQCRATLATLADIKRPAIVGNVNQMNIAHGPQQVNVNLSDDVDSSDQAEKENPPNELLEKKPNEWMDQRAKLEAVEANQTLETVAAIDGAKVA